MKNHIFYFLLILSFFVNQSYSQGILIKEPDVVSVTDSLPHPSAILEITSSDKGFLIPRLYLTGIYDTLTIDSPAVGLWVYNNNDNYIPEGFYYWDSLKWQQIGVSDNAWKTDGNDSIITAGTYFIGTTDNNSLVFKTNNEERMIITNAGNIGIGVTSPNMQLSISKSLSLPHTSNSSTGIIFKDTIPFIHNYRDANCTDGYNVFIGINSGRFSMSSTSYHLVGIGTNTLNAITSGQVLTAVGAYAFQYNTSGIRSAALGYKALNTNTTGTYLTAVGHQALLSNTSGSYSTAMGNNALRNNTTGQWNFALGDSALCNNTTGSYNTAVGAFAFKDSIATTYSNSTAIGYNTKITASNQVRFGNTAVSSIGGYTTWSTFSDGRFKENIQEDVAGLDFILQLRPVTYHYKMNELAAFLNENENNESIIAARNLKSDKKCTGFIAQEVKQAADSLSYSFSGIISPKNSKDLYKLSYADFVVPLVKAVQEQQKMIDDLQNEIILLKNKKEEYYNILNTIKN